MQTMTLSNAVLSFESHRRTLIRQRRLRAALGVTLFAAALAGSWIVARISPAQFVEGLPLAFDYILRTMPVLRMETLGADLGEWYWGLSRWLILLGETIAMGYVGTVLGTVLAVPLSFAAARNLTPHPLVRFVVRRIMEVARAVPELVYALIFVFAFGVGPLAGVLAITVHSLGVLGKLFSEVCENVAPRTLEGPRAAGANWVQTMRFAVLPQVLPNYASYALLRFEINVRSASILGLVGAGGIGVELYTVIRQFIYTDISALVLMIIVTVSITDLACERLRHGLIDPEVRK